MRQLKLICVYSLKQYVIEVREWNLCSVYMNVLYVLRYIHLDELVQYECVSLLEYVCILKCSEYRIHERFIFLNKRGYVNSSMQWMVALSLI